MSHFPRNPWGGARLPESTEPAGAGPLAEVLDALRLPGLDDELAGEERSVARIAAAVHAAGTVDHHGRASMASRRLRLSLTAAFAGAVLVAMSGLAYAGALPAPAQGVASGVLDKVGVSLPASHNDFAADAGSGAPAAGDPSGETGGTEDTGGTTGDDTGDTGDTSGSGDEGSDSGTHGKGKEISKLAHDTPAPGKGKVISVVASNGKSHAGNPPGQAKKGDAGGAHKPSHPDHPSHPSHPDHPSHGGGGNGHGGHGNGS